MLTQKVSISENVVLAFGGARGHRSPRPLATPLPRHQTKLGERELSYSGSDVGNSVFDDLNTTAEARGTKKLDRFWNPLTSFNSVSSIVLLS
jgi:hypothetical protein